MIRDANKVGGNAKNKFNENYIKEEGWKWKIQE